MNTRPDPFQALKDFGSLQRELTVLSGRVRALPQSGDGLHGTLQAAVSSGQRLLVTLNRMIEEVNCERND